VVKDGHTSDNPFEACQGISHRDNLSFLIDGQILDQTTERWLKVLMPRYPMLP
jgi:hypothetical protein